MKQKVVTMWLVGLMGVLWGVVPSQGYADGTYLYRGEIGCRSPLEPTRYYPLNDVTVYMLSQDNNLMYTATTAYDHMSNGRFRFDLPEGTYYLYPYKAGWSTVPGSEWIQTVTLPVPPERLDIFSQFCMERPAPRIQLSAVPESPLINQPFTLRAEVEGTPPCGALAFDRIEQTPFRRVGAIYLTEGNGIETAETESGVYTYQVTYLPLMGTREGCGGNWSATQATKTINVRLQ